MLLLLALLVVVLLAFSAVAVDLGALFVARRDAQSGADLAALSGAQETAGRSSTSARAAVETEVRRIAAANLATTDEEWDACTDPDRPERFTLTAPGTACVSFTDDLGVVRVRVPSRRITTAFARVVGIDTLETSAAAEVTIFSTAGGILPFGLPSGAASGTVACLKTGAQSLDDCDGPETGSFGFLDFARFGNPSIPTTRSCRGGDQSSNIAENIAHGVDHDLGLAAGPTDLEDDHDLCGDNVAGLPTSTDTATGNLAQALDDGLVDGIDIFPGRLTLANPLGMTSCTTRGRAYQGRCIDDAGLWEYLASGSCDGYAHTKEGMIACLEHGDPRFTADIAGSPRFGWVPVLWNAGFPAGNADVPWREFRPIYLQTTLGNCRGDGSCGVVIDPGERFDVQGNHGVVAMTVLLLPLASLPDTVGAARPGGGRLLDFALSR